MENQQNDRTASHPENKAQLMEHIHRSRAALEATLKPLSHAQLTKAGASGWSIKDHLAHLATWELGIAALLRRRSRFAAMQVEEAVAEGKSEEEINALIYEHHERLSVAEVMDQFQEAHRQLLEALEALDDEDLLRPYASFVPEGGDNPRDPVVYWVVGNTFPHFDEHLGYIKTLLSETGK
jgi:hypothetical protein